MKTILVTGASGFIGKRLVKKLIAQYQREKILCLTHDACTQKETQATKYLESLGVQSERLDLVNGCWLNTSAKDFRMVFHLAASTHTEERDHRCNDIGTENLLRYLDSASSPLHIIFTSTMALYDNRSNCRQPIDESADEDINPQSEYGRTKLRAEETLKKVCLSKGFSLTILRLATVYGKGVRPLGMFDALYRMMDRKSPIPRLNWPGLIALVHVDDCVEAICELSELPPSPDTPQIYVVTGENLTLSEIAENIYKSHAVPYKLIKAPKIFWKFLVIIANQKKWLETILPHYIYNRLWQLDLIVNSHMYAIGSKLKSKLPAWKNRKFRDAAHELF